MIWVTDTVNKHKVAVNPSYVVAVFQIPDIEGNEHIGKTAINLTTGNIIVDESDFDIVGQMAAI
jgi:hypothetical protein